MLPTRILPTTYLLIAILVVIAVHLLFPVLVWAPTPWRLLGILPLLLGVGLNLNADRAFQVARTTVRPFEPSSKLVTDGVYRVSRNPMYLGFVLVLLGLGVLLGSLLPFVVVIVFAVLIERNFIRLEEQMLDHQFGAEWRQYTLRTRRWI